MRPAKKKEVLKLFQIFKNTVRSHFQSAHQRDIVSAHAVATGVDHDAGIIARVFLAYSQFGFSCEKVREIPGCTYYFSGVKVGEIPGRTYE